MYYFLSNYLLDTNHSASATKISHDIKSHYNHTLTVAHKLKQLGYLKYDNTKGSTQFCFKLGKKGKEHLNNVPAWFKEWRYTDNDKKRRM